MKIDTEDQVIIGASAVAGGLALVYALSSVAAAPSRNVTIYLTLSVSDGGTTIPEKGVYQYDTSGKVILKAIPLAGYYFNGWYIQGNLLSMDLTYSYNLTENVIISASFVKEDEPVLIPSYITPFQKTKAVLAHNWELWKEAIYGNLGLFVYDKIHFRSKNFEIDTLKFKLCDKNGNGVPNQTIVVYTDSMPDATLYGSLRIGQSSTDLEVRPLDYPLYLITDVNGIVEVFCAYVWFEPITGEESQHDYISTLGRSGKLKWVASGFSSGWVLPIWNLLRSPTYWYTPPFPPVPIPINTYWSEWQLLLDPVYRTINTVHAHWADNPNLLNMGVGSADCNIKMMPSTTDIPQI